MRPTSILTFSGKQFSYKCPRVEQIDIEDIARGLSREARFAGQTTKFYSVAQHSLLVASLVPNEYELEGLLHDAAEAYCKDIPTPLKTLLPDYKKIEKNIDFVIREKYGLPFGISKVVKLADARALEYEIIEYTRHSNEKARGVLKALTMEEAYDAFLSRFAELSKRAPSVLDNSGELTMHLCSKVTTHYT